MTIRGGPEIETATRIRVATSRDVPQISRLVDSYRFQLQVDGPTGFLLPLDVADIQRVVDQEDFFVAQVAGEMAGCSSVVEYDGIIELRSLAVHEEYKRQGLASALIERCKQAAARKGYSILYTLTQTLRPFEKHGFALAEVPVPKLERFCAGCPLFRNGCVEVPMAVRLV